MPSRASTAAAPWRRHAEWALRLAVLGALAVLAWLAGRPAPRHPRAVATGAEVGRALARWSVAPAPDTLHATLDAAPTPAQRDWLRALARAGSAVTWSAPAAAPVAVAAAPAPSPRGGVRLRVAAPSGAHVSLADAAGALGSVTAAGAGGSARLPAPVGTVQAAVGRSGARTALVDSVVLRRVLVLGRAGWEAKFTIAALEEDGWAVDARLAVAPGVTVGQGRAAPLDTSAYAAVVALDSTAAPYAARIARFVRQGGGAVLAGRAAELSALAGLAPGGVGRAESGVAGALLSAEPRRGLALSPLVRLKADAVPLERRSTAVAAAARRAGAGRVVQLGFAETWRWRMLGSGDAPAAHREWWSRVVGSAAYAPAVPRAGAAGARRPALASAPDTVPDAAPYAHAVAELGPPLAVAPVASAADARDVPWWLFPLIAAALLTEWASRRFRGAR
jgi:hypothetical protein